MNKKREQVIMFAFIFIGMLFWGCKAQKYKNFSKCFPITTSAFTFYPITDFEDFYERRIKDRLFEICPKIVSRKSKVGLYVVTEIDKESVSFYALKYPNKLVPSVFQFRTDLTDSVLIDFFSVYGNEFNNNQKESIELFYEDRLRKSH